MEHMGQNIYKGIRPQGHSPHETRPYAGININIEASFFPNKSPNPWRIPMGRLCIYPHWSHNKSTMYVGKYAVCPTGPV